nr:Chain B, CAP-23/NAP-22 [synthetic construct]
GGKLSKKKK